MDWQRGKIPYFVPPPNENSTEVEKGGENIKYGIDQNVEEIEVVNEFGNKSEDNEIK